MKKIYYYLTKHCFLTAFIGASIIWSVLSYNSFYERFDTSGYLHSTIFNTIHKVCSNEKNIETCTTYGIRARGTYDIYNLVGVKINHNGAITISLPESKIIHTNFSYGRLIHNRWHFF